MRIRSLLTTCIIGGALLAACGTPQTPATANTVPVAQAAQASVAPSATTMPTAVPPTATIAPTNTPEPTIAPTSTPEPTLVPTEIPAEPVRLEIPDIALDYKPVPVGLDKNRVPIVLDREVAWYNLSAKPGQGENVVFWAHVLRFIATPNIPAPFERVQELKPGALIIVTAADGKQARYRVTQAVRVKPNQVEYIMPTGKEQLTLVSCIGDKVIENGIVTKTQRLVTIAEPVQE